VNHAEQFEAELPLIERVIAFVARRRRMSDEEAEEFSSTVRLRLIENDYEILRKYEGRSSLQTYLTVVVQRAALDFRVSRWGKWRPSADARRLGDVAVLLERLTVRDGHPFGEACVLMRERHGVTLSDRELDELVASLPSRATRRVVEDTNLEATPAATPGSDHLVETGERRANAMRTQSVLDACLAQLPAQERLLVRLRFDEGLSVAAIAKALRLDQKPLYRRFEAVLRRLREDMEAAGVSGEEAMRLVGDSAVDWRERLPAERRESLRSVRQNEG
jgi:RNA polymerase sigma factor for flagellar operon FliA